MMARMRSITRGDLECLEFMLVTTDLLSPHADPSTSPAGTP